MSKKMYGSKMCWDLCLYSPHRSRFCCFFSFGVSVVTQVLILKFIVKMEIKVQLSDLSRIEAK